MLRLRLRLQYFGHLMGRADSLEKTLMLTKIEGRKQRRWEGWAQVMCTVFPGLSCMCFAKAAGQNLEGDPFARSLLENYLC